MNTIRTSDVVKKPFYTGVTGDLTDIPRFDKHWPIREVVKTVLYNQK